MDLMFKRYSDPFSFIDSMLCYGSFSVSINDVLKKIDNDLMWQFYLHKVIDKSFEDFKSERPTNRTVMSKAEFDATIEMSEAILNGLDPPEGDGEIC